MLLWVIHVGIAQGSGFAPRSVCGAGCDVLSVQQREGTGICGLEFVILAWERANYQFYAILHLCCCSAPKCECMFG